MSSAGPEARQTSSLILLSVAMLAALGGTIALGFTALAFPAEAISNWFLSLIALLCLFLLFGLGLSIWTLWNDHEPIVEVFPLTGFVAVILVGLSAYVSFNIPSYGYFTVAHCLAQRVCLVSYGSSGTYLDIAAVFFGIAFVLCMLAFRQSRSNTA